MTRHRIIFVGFLGALGVFLLILGCYLSSNWWTMLLVVFYIFTPMPLLFAGNNNDGYQSFDGSGTSKAKDIAIFLCTGFLVSTIAFPIMLTNNYTGEGPHITVQNCIFAEFATLFLWATSALFLSLSNEPEF